MLYRLKHRKGFGESKNKQIVRESVSNVNKLGRSYSTTIKQAAMNALLLTSNVNLVDNRTYIESGSIMAENFEAVAGE